jgi:drug/metabolite transporter (DMT)-like permease
LPSEAASQTKESSHRLKVIVSFALVYVFWGSTYLAIGITDAEGLPPLVMCALRFLIAGPLMMAACSLMGRPVRVTRQQAARLAALGCLLLVGGNGGLAWAEQYVPTGFAALVVAITPIWFVLLEAFVFRGDRLSRRGVVGVLLGIAGIAVLFWPKFEYRATLGTMQLLAASTLLCSSFSWAVGSVLSRKWQLSVDPFVATAWEMTAAGVAHLVLATVTGQWSHAVFSRRAMGATLYLVVFGSWVGYSAYIWLLKHVPTPKVATYAYVNPIVAVFLGWVILHERVDVYILLGSAVIVVAVALVTTAQVHSQAEEQCDAVAPEVESG